MTKSLPKGAHRELPFPTHSLPTWKGVVVKDLDSTGQLCSYGYLHSEHGPFVLKVSLSGAWANAFLRYLSQNIFMGAQEEP